jgi:hypothetical protein
MASCKYFVRRGRGHMHSLAPAFFRHGESTLLAAPKLLELHTAAAINSNGETEYKDHPHDKLKLSYS